MWLPNDTPEYWSARQRELIAKHDEQRMVRAARRAVAGDTPDPTKPISAILTACLSAVNRVRIVARALGRAAMQTPRVGRQPSTPERG